MSPSHFDALVAYDDEYVQPLILKALKSQLATESYTLIDSLSASSTQLLQFCAYESIDFERALHSSTCLVNAYIIRKALIRKHYLAQTIFSWTTKNPSSALRRHFKPAVDFELDYAEFLEDALIEAYELQASFEANEGKEPSDREWWILKPSMSDRGQGIRLFSTEDELRDIFQEWEDEEGDDDDDDDDDDNNDEDSNDDDEQPNGSINNEDDPAHCTTANGSIDSPHKPSTSDHIITSHLRHFIAQPYIHPPLLLPQAPFNNRKFHIRTYVLAVGALRVYVYHRMLALFASAPYRPPWDLAVNFSSDTSPETLLQRMRDIHLTNTCVQSSSRPDHSAISTTENPDHPNVFLLSALPLPDAQHQAIAKQINSATAELFRAAVALPTHFQPVPGAFELFGLDFLVEGCSGLDVVDDGGRTGSAGDGDSANKEIGDVNVQLLEVNAFPDFAQTGDGLRDVVVAQLFEEVVRVAVVPFFEMDKGDSEGVGIGDGGGRMTKVLDMDLGRR